MSKKLKHTDFKEALLQDPDVLKAYQDLEEEYLLLNKLITTRKRLGIAQASVAKK